MSPHAPLYSWRKPIYQYVALDNLRRSFNPAHRSALDVGGGTGLLAHTIKSLFGLERVASVDVEDRFFPALDIETAVYDGATLPFPDASFDCILLFNVLHHVPVARRAPLLRECRRVAGDGPVYIKDHVSTGALDDARLAMLDLIGNVPFHGMVSARYLRDADWRGLARDSGYECEERRTDVYRRGLEQAIFPNRLEASFKWRAV
jgi:SAM-dependent methyltransferase